MSSLDVGRKLLEQVSDRDKHVFHFGRDGELAFIDVRGSAVVFFETASGGEVREGAYEEMVDYFNDIAQDYNINKSDLVTEHPEANNWDLAPYDI